MDEVEVPKDYTLLVRGPGVIEILYGEAEIFGARIAGRDKIEVPEGREIPVEAVDEFFARVNGEWSIEERSTIPSGWKEIADSICDKQVVMLIGENDTGKSSLALYLANKAIAAGCKPAIVDSDIGQTDLGPPGTIGVSIVEKQAPAYTRLRLYDAYFIGDKTPTGHLLPMIVGTKLMVDKGLKGGASVVIVNTTGLVHGGVGWALKYYKIEAVQPDLVVAIQKNRELEHILASISVREVKVISPPAAARKKRDERIAYRTLVLTRYLEGSREWIIDLSEVKIVNARILLVGGDAALEELVEKTIGVKPERAAILKDEAVVVFSSNLDSQALAKTRKLLGQLAREYRIVSAERLAGLYVGLYDRKNSFLGVGRLLKVDLSRNQLRVSAKINGGEKSIAKIVFGYLLLDEKGCEKGYLRPGYI